MVLDIRTVTTDARLDDFSVLGMRPNDARQTQKLNSTFKGELQGITLLRNTLSLGLWVFLSLSAPLDVWPIPTVAEDNFIVAILPQHPVRHLLGAIRKHGPRERARWMT